MVWQAASASKQMVDLETKPETSTDDDKKEQTFGLRTDQYAKKGLQVLSLKSVEYTGFVETFSQNIRVACVIFGSLLNLCCNCRLSGALLLV